MTNSYKLTETPTRLFRVLCCLLLLTGLWSINAGAQTTMANYSFASGTSTYTALPSPTVLGTATTTTGVTSLDDVNYRITPAGTWVFTYGGVAKTDVNINTNGYVGFSTAIWTTSPYTAISSANPSGGTSSGLIAAYAADLNAFSTASATPGDISWQLLGSGTDEVLVIQWKNFKNYANNDAVTRRLNFQILLYEDSHSTKPGYIEVNYGACPQGDATSTTVQVGLKGTNNTWATNVNNLRLLNIPAGTTCNWSNAVAGQANNANLTNSNANTNMNIPTDLLYTWSPQSTVTPVRTFSAVSSITNAGATVSWTAPGGAAQYNVQYRVPGTCSWTNWSGNPVTGASVTLTGLAAATSYQVRVQAFNGSNFAPYSHIPNAAGSGDGYALTGTFTTLCNPASLPWSDGWESVVTTGTTSYPTCWAEVGTGGLASSSGQSPITPRTGTRFLLCDWSETNSYMWSPPFSLTAGVTYEFSSYYVTDGLTGWTDIGAFVNTSQVAAGATQLGALVSGATNTSYTQLARQFTPGSTGTYYFAVRVNSTVNPNYMGFDDFSVQVSCSGAPTVGTGASATPVSSPICNSGAVNLNLGSGYSTGGGISYQWKQSTTGVAGTFTDISGATGVTYTTAAITDTMWFKGFVTCSNSGLVDSTAAMQVNVIVLSAPVITSDAIYFCGTGGVAHLKASASPDPGYTWSWSQLEGTPGTSIVAPDSVNFTVSGSVGAVSSIQLTGSFGGCNNTAVNSIGIYGSGTPVITATPNDSLCSPGGAVGLNSGLSAGAFSVSSITYAPVTFVSPATLATSGVATPALASGSLDDGGWSGIPLGFTFDFLGTNYTTVNVGTNGVMQFGAYNGTALGDYTIGALPNGVDPLSAIFMSANDLYLTGAGTNPGSIRYETFGYAPNRRFVLEYKNVPTCCGVGNPQQTLQVICYETTGIVEIHVEKALGTNSKTIGVQNSTGTVGSAAPGRNSFTGTIATPEAWRFAPPANYTMTWTPSGDISGSNTGTNLFSVTTNTISTTTTMGVTALNQTNGCSTTDNFDITVLTTPSNPSGLTGYGANLGSGSATASPHAFCSPQILTATAPAGGASEFVRWYNASTGGSPLQTGAMGASDSYTRLTASSANDTLWVEYYNGICSSAARTAMAFGYSAAPAVTINSLGPDNDTNCGVGPTYVMDYQATSGGSYTYTWTNDGNALTFSDNGSGSASVTSDVTTASTVSAVNGTTGCQTSVAKSLSVYDFPNPTITATPDTICVGDSTVLSSGVTQGNFSVTPCLSAPSYNKLTSGSANYLVQNGVEMTPTENCNFCPLDDAGWDSIPLGFTFNFFGTNFNYINVGTNGNAMFGTYNGANPGGLADFLFAGLPSATEPLNMIALCAVDLNAGVAGSDISYFTTGTAPNRIFVLDYTNVSGFAANGNYTMQLQLHETTGYFEIHVDEASGTGAKSIGVNNGDGTIGAAAPRCAGGIWSGNTGTILATNFAWGFIPPVDYTFAWSPSGEISGSLTGANAVGLPTTVVPATVGYELLITDNVSGCDNSASPDSVYVTVIAPPSAPTVTGEGDFSQVSTSNTINFCGDQTVTMAVSAGGSAGWSAHYYDDAAMTSEVFLANPYNDPYTTASLAATDSLWVTLDNGSCEGPAQLVELVYQVADTIAIANSSPTNCGVGPFSANLTASSTAPYSYTWDASPLLSTLVGPSTTASPVVSSSAFTVTGDDGYCYTSASTSVSVYAIPTVTPTTDVDSVCTGGTATLNSNVSATSFSFISLGYSPQSSTGWTVTTVVTSGVDVVPTDGLPGDLDDGTWSGLPLRFTFDFFGVPYTACNASTNGNIQFASANTGFTPGAIPSVGGVNGFVALCWADLVMDGATNSLRYWTGGTAPNRYFAISYTADFYSGGGEVTGQIELYETTGQVRIFLQTTGGNTTSNKVVGIENTAGTDGGVPTGRNLGPWNVSSPEGWLGEPPHTYSFEWLPAAEITGAVDQSTATASPSVTTNYGLIVQDDITLCFSDTAFVPVIVTTAPPVATWSASPTTGTTGGITTTHVITNNSTNVNGATYAWTWSPNTVTYVNGTSATDREPEVQFNEPGNYSATMTITTCTGSDSFTRNNYINITAEYCFGSFVDDGFICTGCTDDNLNNVSVLDPSAVTIMANLGTGCSNPTGYFEYAPVSGVTTCTMYQGSTYTLSVATSGGFTEYYAAWIDVDNDGDFDDPLEFMGATSSSAASTTFSIGVPSSNVVYGTHRMRVMCNFFGPIGSTDYCVDDCYGEIEDYSITIAPPIIPNDIPTFATSVAYSSNTNYPNCYPINGSTTSATNSPESSGSGADTWYRFVAQSTAVSITMTSSVIDDMIGLYYRDINGAYILVDAENSSVGTGDFERLNADGLTPGTTYYVSTGAVNAPGGSGAFQLCIQHLMPSWCSYAIPMTGFGLCDAYKAQYRGTPAQGVTYDFNFTGVGGGAPVGPTALTGTNGLTTLSQPALALQYDGIYDVAVDVKYSLLPSAGAAEDIYVYGATSMSVNCDNVTIRTQPQIEVKASQRCAATLLRSNYLIGTPVPGNPNACGAINYTFEFTPIDACGGATTGLDTTFTTATPTPYLPLGNLPLQANMGAWRVRIRPNFTYGTGAYGPAQDIQVNSTAASAMAPDSEINNNNEKSLTVSVDANIYPNPNNGEMVNLNVSGVESDNVFVRITDELGREVYSNRFTVDGSLNTIVTFAQPLANGAYNVTFTVDGKVMNERMVVTK
ncbi:MAG: fibronectin type III domain-containing protein [Flavobacteriales bacterium]|nr:fibronectin type III domain-containing protein [Flavobacteriales bacterium]